MHAYGGSSAEIFCKIFSDAGCLVRRCSGQRNGKKGVSKAKLYRRLPDIKAENPGVVEKFYALLYNLGRNIIQKRGIGK